MLYIGCHIYVILNTITHDVHLRPYGSTKKYVPNILKAAEYFGSSLALLKFAA